MYYDVWFITENYFRHVNTKWEPVTIDIFATKEHNEMERFNSKTYWCPISKTLSREYLNVHRDKSYD